MAEVIKYGVILDAELFEYLEAHTAEIRAHDDAVLGHVIARCCRLKADVVQQDKHEETGLRAVLNYGHTFGHALETFERLQPFPARRGRGHRHDAPPPGWPCGWAA